MNEKRCSLTDRLYQEFSLVHLVDEDQTNQFGEDLAAAAIKGDLILLKGDLGAGKTTLARALIRKLAGEPHLDVPSPTFSLVQVYPLEDRIGQIAHFDLYRLADGSELEELGFEETLEDGLTLVEWPERAIEHMPETCLLLEISGARDGGRNIRLSANSHTLQRFNRSLAIRRFLDDNGEENSNRQHLTGDASTRAYENIYGKGKKRILMNAPAMPDGPVIQDGKSYSALAHLAEDVSAFVAIDHYLLQNGFRVPQIYAADLDQGFLLIEDLGDEPITDRNNIPLRERYIAAAKLLADLHSLPIDAELPVPGGKPHKLQPFDHGAMRIEVDLFANWYAPRALGRPLSETERSDFNAIWNELINQVQGFEKRFVLRDFHSPNILWQKDAGSLRNQVGLIDFQDAMIGPASYDVASIAHDARKKVSAGLEAEMIAAYVKARKLDGGAFDESEFEISFAIMAAQRATKVLGIFVRLDERDHKPAYLTKIPQIRIYLSRALQHPALAGLKAWYADVAGI